MSSGNPSNAASRSKTYSAAATNDTTGVKAATATLTTASVLTTGDFVAAVATLIDLPRTIVVTRSSSAAAYTTSGITVSGYRGGKLVDDILTPLNANGNDSIRGKIGFDKLVSISVPAQVSTAGSFTFGLGDICSPVGSPFCAVELTTAGTAYVQYGENVGAPTDAIPLPAADPRNIAPTRVLTGSSGTTVGLTVYVQ